jgi:hypothetical protein
VTLHFAYGSNMSRALMVPRCPSAVELGTAVLAGYRFCPGKAAGPKDVGEVA